MTFEQTDLAVRQHDRYECELRAEIGVAPASEGAVRLSRSAPGAGGRVPVRVVDLSRGGVGINSPVLFPQTCRIALRLSVPSAEPGGAALVFETALRIQRATMTDRTPTYYLGTSFEEHGPDHEKSVARLMEAVRGQAGSAPVPAAAKGGARA